MYTIYPFYTLYTIQSHSIYTIYIILVTLYISLSLFLSIFLFLSLNQSINQPDWEDGATANKIELAAAFTEDWDDQTIEDDFANQLRAELQKIAK